MTQRTPNTFSLYLKTLTVLYTDEVCLKGLTHIYTEDEKMKVKNNDIKHNLEVPMPRVKMRPRPYITSRQRRGINTSRRGRGSTFTASRPPRGEASASRHTSLIRTTYLRFNNRLYVAPLDRNWCSDRAQRHHLSNRYWPVDSNDVSWPQLAFDTVESIAGLGVDHETANQPCRQYQLLPPSLAEITPSPHNARRHETTNLLSDT